MTSRETTIRYIERTRDYYRSLGYAKDYVWSHFDDVPFAKTGKPLSAMRIGLVSTANPVDHSNQDAKGIRRVWSGSMDSAPSRLDTDNLAWDKDSTHTDDRESFLPTETLKALVQAGVVGSLTPRFHGVPTEYSQRKTVEIDAPNVLARLREDGADAALLCAL